MKYQINVKKLFHLTCDSFIVVRETETEEITNGVSYATREEANAAAARLYRKQNNVSDNVKLDMNHKDGCARRFPLRYSGPCSKGCEHN